MFHMPVSYRILAQNSAGLTYLSGAEEFGFAAEHATSPKNNKSGA
jgi:hypothetical protein